MRHEIVIAFEDGKWRGVCRGCRAAMASSHKPAVDTWRREHYRRAVSR